MNIEQIDKWLNEEYGCSYTRLEELHNYFFEKYTDQKEEIERLIAESTEWESKFYDEAKKVDKAIDLLEGARENIDLPIYDRQHLIEKTINELKGDENE